MSSFKIAIANVGLDISIQEVASTYTTLLKNKSQNSLTPIVNDNCTSTWAQYSVRVLPETNNQRPTTNARSELQVKLKEAGIPAAIHYPMPLYLQECFEYLRYKEDDFPISELISQEIMSFPMNPYVTNKEIKYIMESILQ